MKPDYYCSQKFDWVEVRLYDGVIASCCQADHNKITLQDLESHPVGFFNFPLILQERQAMLAGERVDSCNSCWKLEDQNIKSRRIEFNSQHQIYTDVVQKPKTLNLVLSNTCLQSCIYCGKMYSHSWLKDVVQNGDYNIPGYSDRYNQTPKDQVIVKLGQKDFYKSNISIQLLNQIESVSNSIERLIITGGEPLLDNQLVNIVKKLEHIPDKTIFTGLGLQSARLKNIAEQLLNVPGLKFTVSAENLFEYHEFNRYGTSFDQWEKNLNLLKQFFKVEYASVVSNLTLFNLPEFLIEHEHDHVSFYYANDPAFLSPSVLDDPSKLDIINRLSQVSHPAVKNIVKYIQQPTDSHQRENLSKFLNRYCNPRNLSIDIFPKSFQEWIEQ